MIFIDGENLVCRYQAMLEENRQPQPETVHARDTYVWTNFPTEAGFGVILRGTYYTYVVGDEEKRIRTIEELRALKFRQTFEELPANLHAVVFKKEKKSRGKGVDIQLSVDILSNVYQDNLDTVYLISGDGDYAPLIQESQRRGKQVFVAALSSGLSPILRQLADRFNILDGHFFKPTK